MYPNSLSNFLVLFFSVKYRFANFLIDFQILMFCQNLFHKKVVYLAMYIFYDNSFSQKKLDSKSLSVIETSNVMALLYFLQTHAKDIAYRQNTESANLFIVCNMKHQHNSMSTCFYYQMSPLNNHLSREFNSISWNYLELNIFLVEMYQIKRRQRFR